MNNFISTILNIISRGIWKLIPNEFKIKTVADLDAKIKNNLIEETFINFKDEIKKSILFYDTWKIRDYSIQTSLLNDKNKEFYYL